MNTQTNWNEVWRITGSVTVCMMLGRYLQLAAPVYLALFPILTVTKAKSFSCRSILAVIGPALPASAAALITVQLFSDHPFVVWSISLLLFDLMRRSVTHSHQVGTLLMSLFNWIFIVVAAQTSSETLATQIWEIALSIVLSVAVIKLFAWLFPPTEAETHSQGASWPIGYRQRLNFLLVLGSGLALLMIIDLRSATFCLVPVILAAAQPHSDGFMKAIKLRFASQVGGCALAAVFILMLAGQHNQAPLFMLFLGGTVFYLARKIASSAGSERELHGDALLGIALPIQLYMGATNFGLVSTVQRGWQLAITLLLLTAITGLLYGQAHYESGHHSSTQSG